MILGHREDGVVNIGDNAIIRSGSVIYSDTKIGVNFRTGHNVLIRENTEIGDNVLVGTNSVVENNCKIGSNVSIQTGVYITTNTTIEDEVFMGPHSVTTNDKYVQVGAELIGPTIKKGAKIGANAVFLPGIIVGEEAVIGSGAVVTKDVRTVATVIGNPAREIQRKRI
ncbi:DapH/DapD/GlmU-related protein [Chloroflexota bacterium]